MRNRVITVIARKKYRGKDDVREYAIKAAKQQHNHRQPGLEQDGVCRCLKASMQPSDRGKEFAGLSLAHPSNDGCMSPATPRNKQ